MDWISFVLFRSRVGDVVQLFRYTYDNTVRSASSPCTLRELIIAFAACQAEVLWQNMEFQSLFTSCGELAVDLFSESMKRMT